MATTERELLIRILHDSFEKKGWHGPTLRGALRGLTPNQAFWRPAHGRHSIWDLVLHCAYWKYAAWRKLTGTRRGSFPRKGSNWFEPPLPTRKAWREDVTLLAESHRQLCDFVADAPLKLIREKARLIYGVAAHDAYHAGQIQMLKRLYGL